MKTRIEADLIPVLGEIEHAGTGDFLIVVRGVCVGVQYKEDWPALPAPPPLRKSPTAVMTESQYSPIEADVLEAIRRLRAKSEASNSMNIAEALGIERDDKVGRQLLSQVVQGLKKKALIKKATDDRIPNYLICESEVVMT